MNIVLVGNPNVGKSVIFNSLTGSYVTVSNYPGTTVDISRGIGRFGGQKFSVIDTPGINSLEPTSEDEKVTRDIVSRGDVSTIVQVADSKNLKRSLMLTLELAALKIPLVLNLNMHDEAAERGIKIDTKLLSGRLGIEVVETVAITGEGITKLKDALLRAKVPNPDILPQARDRSGKRFDAIGMLHKRSRAVDNLLKEAVSVSISLKKDIAETIGRFTIRPISGIPILMLIIIFMYLFVGRFAAGTAVDFFENTVFGRVVNPFFINFADKYIGINILKEFLVGDYGIITMALTYAFAIIFPIVTAFFLFFGVLEDSGYLPRLSILSDRIFKTMGLNGRAVLPIVLGLGCGTMATLTARILDTKKERILVTLLLALAIPCSAQLGVIMGMLGSLSARALILWLAVLLLVMITVGFAASKVIAGERSPFIQEIPPIRMPQAKNIFVKTFARLKWYLKEAVPLFVLGTAMLFIFDKTGLLKLLEKALSPLVVTLLGLPEKATEAFIIGFLRRDYGAAGLYVLSKTGALDKIQVLVSLIVITLFVPCVAQFFVTVKERGIRTACIIGAFVFIFAFLMGGVLNSVLRYLVLTKGIAVL
ncbi:MAG: ferrous iron transporter B [Candidatus Omnitrophota bacterium]|nr:ferrous iron transporter B [Candidatus Omnitrophota bacterium]